MMTAAGAALIVSAVTAAAPADRPGRALFERAEANFNRGQFEAARADYQAAYDVEPLPAFLFNIGQCYRNLGDYSRAQFFFHRFVVLDPQSPNRPAAERLTAEMGKLEEERRAAQAHAQPPPPGVAPATLAANQGGGNDAAGVRMTLEPASAPPAKPPAFYRRAWFWAGVGGVILLGGVAALALSQGTPSGTLPSIDAR